MVQEEKIGKMVKDRKHEEMKGVREEL